MNTIELIYHNNNKIEIKQMFVVKNIVSVHVEKEKTELSIIYSIKIYTSDGECFKNRYNTFEEAQAEYDRFCKAIENE